MKNVLLGFLIFTTVLASCDKDDNPPAPKTYPIQGLWIGTYTIDGQPGVGQQAYTLAIKPDGTITVDTRFNNQQQLAIGTWTLTGPSLTTTYTYVYGSGTGTQQATTITWDNSGKLTGTYRNTTPSNGITGTITLTRVN